jgi:predicted ABC-type ATPase
MPPVGEVLRCPHCADERPFVRPPLLVVTGAAGVGKSTVCARLAGTISGTLLLDADIFGTDLISVAPPNQDYPAFWRSMMRLAHELAQNNVVVVYFSTMLPEQLLANSEAVKYFDSVHFLCLTCPPNILRARLVAREGGGATALIKVGSRIKVWRDFNSALTAAASDLPTATVLDAGRTVDEVEHDVRRWITVQQHRSVTVRPDSIP